MSVDPLAELLEAANSATDDMRARRELREKARESERARRILDGTLQTISRDARPVAFVGVSSSTVSASVGDGFVVASIGAACGGFLPDAPLSEPVEIGFQAQVAGDPDERRTVCDAVSAILSLHLSGRGTGNRTLVDGSRRTLARALIQVGGLSDESRSIVTACAERWPVSEGAIARAVFVADDGGDRDIVGGAGDTTLDFALSATWLGAREWLGPFVVGKSVASKKRWSFRKPPAGAPLTETIDALLLAAASGELTAVYLRPDDGPKTIRIELPKVSDRERDGWLSALAAETASPQIPLPYPIWLARTLSARAEIAARALRAAGR